MIVVMLIRCVVVVVIIVGEAARTGRRGRHSTTGLAVVSAAILVISELDQVVGEDHAKLRRERGVEGVPVGSDGCEAGLGPGLWFGHAPDRRAGVTARPAHPVRGGAEPTSSSCQSLCARIVAMDSLVVGGDGLSRCAWGCSTPEYQDYHDEEWGRPVGDEGRIFETLCLEGFQSGLSWLTILRRREGFRSAFAGFEPSIVGDFGESDVERILSDPAVVRHRGKIVATIENARATNRLHDEGASLAALLWKYERSAGEPPNAIGELPPSTAESKALSAELRRKGFKFVGPTTAYATMQALGVVNDHLEGCHFRAVALSERARFHLPLSNLEPEGI
jgi:DNA-3-methyladenine glycosylase I